MPPSRRTDGYGRRPARPQIAPRQRSFEDQEVALYEVTFCAVDLETTGGSPKDSEIVEIGAVKSRGGETLGTLQTFVKPSADLPVEIQLLTGIRPSMLAEAPPLPSVLPALLEFCRGCVFVAHNARFDHSFIERACAMLDYESFEIVVVDTAKLARRLLRGDVPNVRLATLARFFRTPHQPEHRAFPDAAACLEVLHGLLERAAAYGVTTLADLLDLQRPSSNPHFDKVRIARTLPGTPGVYLFRNARREVIYVGKATNLRARVRSYFTTDDRKRIGDLLAEIADVSTIPCRTDVEARALEARLIEHLAPRHNRRGVRRRAPSYLKLTAERHPRFSVVGKVSADGAVYIGPFPSRARARAAGQTLAALFGIRTCTLHLGAGRRHAPCPLYDLGTCHGPCTDDRADVAAHDRAVRELRDDLHGGMQTSAGRLAEKLSRLARQERFEEAGAHRDAFEDAIRSMSLSLRLRAVAQAGRLVASDRHGTVQIADGCLGDAPSSYSAPAPDPADCGPLALDARGLEERKAIASWLERSEVRLVSTERPFAYPWPLPALPRKIPVEKPTRSAPGRYSAEVGGGSGQRAERRQRAPESGVEPIGGDRE